MTPKQIDFAVRRWLLATDEFRFFLEEYAAKSKIEFKKEAARELCDTLYDCQRELQGIRL